VPTARSTSTRRGRVPPVRAGAAEGVFTVWFVTFLALESADGVEVCLVVVVGVYGG